jgi:hypothetical protein
VHSLSAAWVSAAAACGPAAAVAAQLYNSYMLSHICLPSISQLAVPAEPA